VRCCGPRIPASSQFSRMGTPQEGSRSLVATARGGHSAAAHNRRPRRWVHLTLQIHNSLILCRAKRPAATALMDTDKWSLEESRSRSPASSASSSFVSAESVLASTQPRPTARYSEEQKKGRLGASVNNGNDTRFSDVSLFCDRGSWTARFYVTEVREIRARAREFIVIVLHPLKFLP